MKAVRCTPRTGPARSTLAPRWTFLRYAWPPVRPRNSASQSPKSLRQRSHAIVVTSDSMFFTERVKLQALVQTTRLPAAYALRDNVVAADLRI